MTAVVREARRGSQATFYGVYANCVNVATRVPEYMTALTAPGSVPYADGMAVVWAARVLSAGVPEKCTTTDLYPMIMDACARDGLRVFLLGSAPGVAEECARRTRESHPGVRIVGTRHGYFDTEDCDDVIEEINDSGADVLFVGMGMPRQEIWTSRNRHRIKAGAVLTCGACLDFHAGLVRRAPQWMRTRGMEWLFRLLLEPRRLWRRYLLGNVVFVGRVLRWKISRRARRSVTEGVTG